MIVYALSDPRTHEVRYVGATRTKLHRRVGRHVSAALAGKTSPVAEWLRAVGWPHSVVLEVLPASATAGQLRAAEQWWIDAFGTSDLLNCCAPGSHRHWD